MQHFSSPSDLMKSSCWLDESLSSTTNVLFQRRIYLLLNSLSSFWMVHCFLSIATCIIFWNVNLWLIFLFLICFIYASIYVFFPCSERKLSLSFLILLWFHWFTFIFMLASLLCFKKKLLLLLLLLPMTVGLESTPSLAVLFELHCFCTLTTSILFVQLSGSLSSVWTALLDCPLVFLLSVFSSDANWLCNGLLLVHPESLYLGCLTLLCHILALQKLTYLLKLLKFLCKQPKADKWKG